MSLAAENFSNLLIIGASRGLGRSLGLFAGEHLSDIRITRVARRFGETDGAPPKTESARLALDMSKEGDQARLAAHIVENNFDLVVYCAGGGPHGPFVEKDWKDHRWSLEVNLLAPMQLALAWLKVRDPLRSGRFVIVGSRIAESSPDPFAASYATGKHGLVGFVGSLQKETELNRNKIWLFSPGYMDTDLLPRTAPVRHDGSKLMSADTAAQALLRWVKKDGPWHRILN